MNQRVNQLFLEALKAALKGEEVSWTENDVTLEDLSQLFEMAQIHSVLPMIYEAVSPCPASVPAAYLIPQVRRMVMRDVVMQTMKTAEFGQLSNYLRQAGLKPVVVKGVICRDLYPNPDARISGDEDVFIPEEQFEEVHKRMMEWGMTLSDPDKDIRKEHEVPYGKAGSVLYIELHKHMFPPESEAYGDLNRFFDGIFSREAQSIHHGECGLIEIQVGDVQFLTMNHTDHLLYLILHSFKHFLHSGFGIRQVCDINMYAERYGSQVDWEYVLASLREVRADLFAASMFVIGEKYLGFDLHATGYPGYWRQIEVDESAMLADLLASGVFGGSDMSRKHSSNITLNAMIADKRGEVPSSGRVRTIVKAVCLPLDSMKGRYPYLKKMPILLPIAWAQRVLTYRKETAGNASGNNAVESIKIGSERIELMKQYGIIKS